MAKKKEKMIVVAFTVSESMLARMNELQRREKQKSRSVFCRGLMTAMVGAMEDWDKRSPFGPK